MNGPPPRRARLLAVVSILLSALGPLGVAALAQEEGFDLPEVMADFWASKEGKDVIAEYTSPGSQVDDPAGDAEFSTGEQPGLPLDPNLDLLGSRVDRFSPPPDGASFFDPVGDGGVVCNDRDTDGPVPDVRTICPDGYDPTAYGDGSIVGALYLDGPIGFFDLSMICEWVMWYRDPDIPGVFQPLDAYPLDPAGGTNTAIGLRAEPAGVRPFRLVLTDQGGFAEMPTNSVVAIGGNQLALYTPATEMSRPDQARAYTFCTEGGYQAADSVADSTDIFEPPGSELAFVAPTTTTTSSTTTTSTTTTTTVAPTTIAPPVTSPPTTIATSEGGGTPWLVYVSLGLITVAIGIWMLAARKGCTQELQAWQKAQEACREARDAAEKAAKKVEDIKQDLENAEDELDKLHEDVPPIDWEGDPSDSWVENPDVPGSRIDRFDLYVRRSWASAQWGRYRSGEITAQEVEKAWDTNPPEPFAQDLRDAYDKAKSAKKELDEKIAEDEKSLQQAKDDQAKADRDADQACARAEEARQAYERCMSKPTPPSAPPGGTGTATPGGSGTSTGGSDQPQGCHDGDPEELRNVRSMRVIVPVRMEPLFAGGAAHAASEQAKEIGAGLKQASTVVEAFGRFLSFKSGAKLVHEFDVKTAADLGVSGASEVTGIPIPTSVAGAATGVAKVVIDAAGAAITKVTELQERRLPDVDLTITIKAEPITLTCAEVWVCRNGVRVLDRKRLTIEKGNTISLGSRHWNALTWAQAQERAASFGANRYRRSLQRALQQLADFQAECAGG